MMFESLRDELLSLTARLVETNSVTGREGPCAETLLDYFKSKSIHAELEEVQPGRWNLIARVPGTGTTLLFNGHTDMVDVIEAPLSWSSETTG